MGLVKILWTPWDQVLLEWGILGNTSFCIHVIPWGNLMFSPSLDTFPILVLITAGKVTNCAELPTLCHTCESPAWKLILAPPFGGLEEAGKGIFSSQAELQWGPQRRGSEHGWQPGPAELSTSKSLWQEGVMQLLRKVCRQQDFERHEGRRFWNKMVIACLCATGNQ